MAFSKSTLAYEDVRETLDRALEARFGIQIRCTNKAAAIQLRARINYFRKLDRQRSLLVYQSDHPMYGRSAYDGLVVAIPKEKPLEHLILIEKRTHEVLDISEIEGPRSTDEPQPAQK